MASEINDTINKLCTAAARGVGCLGISPCFEIHRNINIGSICQLHCAMIPLKPSNHNTGR